MSAVRYRWPGVLLLVALLGVWELASARSWVDPVTVPRVSTIFEAWWDAVRSGDIPSELEPTLRRIVMGMGLATVLGISVGLLMGTVPLVHRILEPVTELVRPVPSTAYIPVAILILGLGDQMKVFVIFMGCFFPVLLNTYGSVRGINPTLVDTGRTFGLGRIDIVRNIVLPASLPGILTGIRISLAIALIVAVVSEMLAGNSGIGYFVLSSQRTFRVPEVFAGLFTIGALGYAMNAVFVGLEKYLLRWRPVVSA